MIQSLSKILAKGGVGIFGTSLERSPVLHFHPAGPTKATPNCSAEKPMYIEAEQLLNWHPHDIKVPKDINTRRAGTIKRLHAHKDYCQIQMNIKMQLPIVIHGLGTIDKLVEEHTSDEGLKNSEESRGQGEESKGTEGHVQNPGVGEGGGGGSGAPESRGGDP